MKLLFLALFIFALTLNGDTFFLPQLDDLSGKADFVVIGSISSVKKIKSGTIGTDELAEKHLIVSVETTLKGNLTDKQIIVTHRYDDVLVDDFLSGLDKSMEELKALELEYVNGRDLNSDFPNTAHGKKIKAKMVELQKIVSPKLNHMSKISYKHLHFYISDSWNPSPDEHFLMFLTQNKNGKYSLLHGRQGIRSLTFVPAAWEPNKSMEEQPIQPPRD